LESILSGIYYAACDEHYDWDVARNVADIFAGSISEINLENRLIKHFLASGWSVEDIDNWLAQKPRGKDSFWVKERLRFSVKHHRAEELIDQLAVAVRNSPEDIPGALDFLDALIYSRRNAEQWDVSWIGEICKPGKALQAAELADRLKILENWDTAAKFYSMTMTIPLTPEEAHKLMMSYQVAMSEQIVRAGFAVRVRESLCKCLLELGRNEEAQKLMEEAVMLRKEHKLNDNLYLAGKIQAASGARVIEEGILEEEESSRDDPRYWLNRASYYRGRNEIDQEEEAYRKALPLTVPAPKPRGKVPENIRAEVIRSYAWFLKRQKRDIDAVSLLKREMLESPADSSSAQTAARMLAFEFQKMIDPNEDIYWAWLERRMKWEHNEERLLWEMLKNVERDEIAPYFIRAEKLCEGAEPTRSKALGFIMNRMGFPRRSIPLLKYAAEHGDSEDFQESAIFYLFESYLDCRYWESAEQIFPRASKRLTARELPEWLGKIAVIAAQAGARGDAIRIWKVVSNIAPTELRGIEELVAAGLSKELKEHYQDMQAKLPGSVAPQKALTIVATE
jgi:tetratricopeptide (TPR) repeat protein